MSQELLQIEQASQVSAELANSYLIGGLTDAAGLPGGIELQDKSVGLLASLGVEVSGSSESGFASIASVAAVRASLAGTTRQAASSIAANPRQWGIAIGSAVGLSAAGVGIYTWMNEDQQIALENIRQDAALKAKALESLPEDQRIEVAKILANRTIELPSTNILPWVIGGAVVAAFFLLRK